MSRGVSRSAIGGFVLGALALIVVGVGVLGSGKLFRRSQEFVMFFEGSVSGLNEGAPVVFRGVKIGSVKDIQLVFNPRDSSFRIPVIVELEPHRVTGVGKDMPPQEQFKKLVESGLRAQLVTQSYVTGQLMISLDFLPEKPAEFKGDSTLPEIPTVPTVMQQLARKLEDLPLEEMVNKIVKSVDGIEALINSPELRGSLGSMEKALQELAELAKNLNSQVGPLASSLKDTIREYGKLAKETDAQVLRTSNAAQDAIRELGRLAQEVERAVSLVSMNLGRTLESADSAAEQARKSLDSIERITEENSPLVQGFTNAMEEMASAARSIRVLADYLSRHPEALLQGKGSPKGR
jgi:paraquat-inducible protein B